MRRIAPLLGLALLWLAGCGGADPGSYTFVVLPDLQNYNKYAKNQGNLVEMIRWIVDHADEERIVLVLQEGDLVEQNAIDEPGGKGLSLIHI